MGRGPVGFREGAAPDAERGESLVYSILLSRGLSFKT